MKIEIEFMQAQVLDQFTPPNPTPPYLPTNHALYIKAAEYWLKLGEADEALRELENLPRKTWEDPHAAKIRIAALGMLSQGLLEQLPGSDVVDDFGFHVVFPFLVDCYSFVMTPFFWLGDTWWMGLCNRIHWPDEFRSLATDRREKGFNVIQIVAGLYPDMPPFDPRGANEAGFPWETNYTSIRPEYFDKADQRLGYLVQEGFAPCIVGAWGYFLPWMGVEKVKAHWRYLIARYGAWPVVWCVAGEANLPWYLVPKFPYDDREQVHGWTEVMEYVRETDPFHRLVTIHPTAIGRYTARHATDDAGLLDFDMLQTPHGQHEAVPITIGAVRDSYASKPVMPVIDGEASYEMLGDSLPTEWTRRMFWICMMNGAAGHTYGANGIWQCNRPGQPHGKSPHGGSYGQIPWSEAVHLPGSKQLGLAKVLLQQYPWQRFEPHPEWVVSPGDSLVVGRYGEGPWGRLAEGNDVAHEPQAAGIPGLVRLIYVPQREPVEVRSLGPHAKQNAIRFDPVSGVRTPLGTIQADAQGSWKCPAPSDLDHDWVMILETPDPKDQNTTGRSLK